MWLAAALGLGVGLMSHSCAGWLARRLELGPSPHAVHRIILPLVHAALFALLQHFYGWSGNFWIRVVYCSLLLLIAVMDLQHSLIPNILVGAGLLLTTALATLHSPSALATTLLGAIVGGGIFASLALLRRNALGMGDVKLAALIGMMTGFPWVLQALTLGIVLGGLAAAVMLLTRMRQPKQYMPYAPYLVAGCIATLLSGNPMMNWYLHMAWGG